VTAQFDERLGGQIVVIEPKRLWLRPLEFDSQDSNAAGIAGGARAVGQVNRPHAH